MNFVKSANNHGEKGTYASTQDSVGQWKDGEDVIGG